VLNNNNYFILIKIVLFEKIIEGMLMGSQFINEGKHKIELCFSDEQFRTIISMFATIKKGGSRLKSKEEMMKLLVLRETQLCDVLYDLTGFIKNGKS